VAPGRRSALERLVLHATTLRIPILEVEGGTLTAVTGFDGHQGVALVARRRPSVSLADIVARCQALGDRALVLAIDSLEDPQNLGTLLRSAEAAGVAGVLLPSRRTARLSPSAIKASAGAVEHLDIAVLDDLAAGLAELHVRGLRIVGSDADARLTARDADLRGPLVVVIGSESTGMSSAVRRRCDVLVRIPMHGKVGSLNAAVAGSVLLYEVLAQRTDAVDADGSSRSPAPAEVPGHDSAADTGSRPRQRRTRTARPTAPREAAPETADETEVGDGDLLPEDRGDEGAAGPIA
jgi:23S rRNA (guanosine2251-2'-O)-methyltransferase